MSAISPTDSGRVVCPAATSRRDSVLNRRDRAVVKVRTGGTKVAQRGHAELVEIALEPRHVEPPVVGFAGCGRHSGGLVALAFEARGHVTAGTADLVEQRPAAELLRRDRVVIAARPFVDRCVHGNERALERRDGRLKVVHRDRVALTGKRRLEELHVRGVRMKLRDHVRRRAIEFDRRHHREVYLILERCRSPVPEQALTPRGVPQRRSVAQRVRRPCTTRAGRTDPADSDRLRQPVGQSPDLTVTRSHTPPFGPTKARDRGTAADRVRSSLRSVGCRPERLCRPRRHRGCRGLGDNIESRVGPSCRAGTLSGTGESNMATTASCAVASGPVGGAGTATLPGSHAHSARAIDPNRPRQCMCSCSRSG